MFTVDEVAKRLDVSVKTIRRYIYSGKIGANKIGGQWRIAEEDIDIYINGQKNKCCQPEVSQDDFCIFMDTDYFSSEDQLQLCTIVDYYVSSVDDISKMSQVVTRAVTEDGIHGGKAQYNYVYDDALKRARFVLWGTVTFINTVTHLLKPFEGGSDE
jgi:excisionase family DNA binding protein